MITEVSPELEEQLKNMSMSEVALIEALGIREQHREATGLDEQTFCLVKIAALIAMEAPPASYIWQVKNAVAAGVSADHIVGVLRAVAPQVGFPRVLAAAPEIMVALELDLPVEAQY